MAVNPQDVEGFGGQTPGVQIGGVTTTIPYTLEAAQATQTTTGAAIPVSFSDALDALSLIEAQYEGIEIMAALPNQGYDDTGALVDTVDVSYRIIGRPGVFTVSVPYDVNWSAIAFFYVGLQANTIELIYEGAGSLNETPTVLLVQPPSNVPPELIPQPGQPVPV